MAGRTKQRIDADGPARLTSALTPAKAQDTYQKLRAAYPDAHCELDHGGPFQLLVATVLSAQSTDVAVNRVTPNLFRRWPNAAAMAKADLAELELAIGSIGMFRQKARHLVGLSNQLVQRYGGQVPRRLATLVELPGVGRKTANVVLGVAFGAPEGVVVDTHVQRLSQRLGWTKATDPGPIESELMQLFPRQDWDLLSHTLIFHGRRCCTARSPACAACPVVGDCPSAFRAESIGRKASTSPRAIAVTRTAVTPALEDKLPIPPAKSAAKNDAAKHPATKNAPIERPSAKNAPAKSALSRAATRNTDALARTDSATRSRPQRDASSKATLSKKKRR